MAAEDDDEKRRDDDVEPNAQADAKEVDFDARAEDQVDNIDANVETQALPLYLTLEPTESPPSAAAAAPSKVAVAVCGGGSDDELGAAEEKQRGVNVPPTKPSAEDLAVNFAKEEGELEVECPNSQSQTQCQQQRPQQPQPLDPARESLSVSSLFVPRRQSRRLQQQQSQPGAVAVNGPRSFHTVGGSTREREIQHRLSAFSADNFSDDEFSDDESGLSIVGADIRLHNAAAAASTSGIFSEADDTATNHIPRVTATLAPDSGSGNDPPPRSDGGEEALVTPDRPPTWNSMILSVVDPIDFAHALAVPMDTVIQADGDDRDEGYGDSTKEEGTCCRLLLDCLLSDRRRCAAAACALVVLAGVAGLTGGLLAVNNSGSSSSSNQSSMLSLLEEEDPAVLEDIRTMILELYETRLPYLPDYAEALYDEYSDQYAALHWLAYDDPATSDTSFDDDSLDASALHQRYTAAALYFSTGGGGINATTDRPTGTWGNAFYFLSERSECDWIEDLEDAGYWGPRGISCDGEGRVNTISLYSNNLTGTIPPELAFFEDIDLLYLIDNQMRGTLPSALGELKTATEVMISLNPNIDGTIPPEIGNMEKLNILSIWGNKLNGTIPTELAKLKNLERLTLRNCSVTGTVPTEFGQLLGEGGSLLSMYFQYTNMVGSMEFLCPGDGGRGGNNSTGDSGDEGTGGTGGIVKHEWYKLVADCLKRVECSCCTQCF